MKAGEIESIQSNLTSLIKEVHSLVGEFKHYREDVRDFKEEQKDQNVRIRSIENKLPGLEEARSDMRKIRNSIIASIIAAVVIGGLIGRMIGG